MAAIVSDPNTLTKDKLKTELQNHGVQLPPSDSRKQVYVDLYRQHLIDKSERNGVDMFSSDDEVTLTPSKRKKKPGTPRKAEKSSKPSKATDSVYSLSDNDLFMLLKEHGIDAGPILDSTRRIYQKKLERVLHASTKAEPLAVKVKKDLTRVEPEENEFSDRDDAVAESKPAPQIRQRPKPKSSPKKAPSVNLPVTNEVKKPVENNTPVTKEPETKGHKVMDAKPSTSDANVTTAKKRSMPIALQVGLVVGLAIIIYFIIQQVEPWGKTSKIGQLPSAK